MSSRYQRQMGRRSGPSSSIRSGPRTTSPDDMSEALARADRARRLREQRIANIRRDEKGLDAKFGYEEFDFKHVQELKSQLQKKERQEMLQRQVGTDKADAVVKTAQKVGVLDDTIIYDAEGFVSVAINGQRRGWVFNMVPTTIPPSSSNDSQSTALGGDDSGGFVGAGEEDGAGEGGMERAGVELFLIDEENRRFKATVVYEPYFYLIPEDKTSASIGVASNSGDVKANDTHDLQAHYQELTSTILRLYQPRGLNRVEILRKMDLDAPNHLGLQSQNLGGRPMIKLIFDNVEQLQRVKKEVMEVLKTNERKRKDQGDEFQFATFDANYNYDEAITTRKEDPLASLIDIREHDVPYLVRVCIDLGLRAGCWYTLTPQPTGGVTLSDRDNLQKANPTVLAFDIECTKAPLKFPDSEVDSIFMISYMVNGQGYLLLSRHVVGKDVANFEYTPKPKYPGPFIVINELTEEALIRRFLTEFHKHAPQIVVTYNGDFFDWPFLERRAAEYGLDLRREIGFYNAGATAGGGGGDGSSEYRGRTAVHLDAFCWVKRDSYLPQGSQGLKAVTKYKLGYDPVEVDPEDMVRYARDRPAHMASYSVSDAVATYYLYDKYVHMFIFSLATIIPMGPEDVLRKGSGTLCEALLMVEACTKSIICPNKQVDPVAKFTEKGNLLESETYIGGKVECLETGVYRSDIEYKFDMKPEGFQGLIDNVDRVMTFAIEVEGGIDRRKITNYDEVRSLLSDSLFKKLN